MIIYTTFLPKGISGMSLYPFILLRHRDESRRAEIILRHERIHQKQQEEILVVALPFVACAAFCLTHWLWLALLVNPFYIWYGAEYLIYRLRRYDHQSAYLSISFEQEAFDNQFDESYLRFRDNFAHLNYL